MEIITLQDIYQEDREMLLANMDKNRAPEAVQAAMEREIDRMTVRYVEQCPDEALAAHAQSVLQAVKASLPLIGAVNESKVWKKTLDTGGAGKKLPNRALIWLGVGAVLVLSAVFATQLGQTGFSLMSTLRGLVPTLLGGVCLFRGGTLAAKPAVSADSASAADVRVEYLVDTQKAWHALRAVMVVADGRLQAAREEMEAKRTARAESAPESALPGEMLELLSGLLEIAYSRRDERDADAMEMISAIRYYLHGAQVDAVDYDDVHDGWFEFLPSPKAGTLRPALITGDRLLKKGLASA